MSEPTVIDNTNGDFWRENVSRSYIIRDSGTYLGLLSFDDPLEAFDAARRYGKPLEINWATK